MRKYVIFIAAFLDLISSVTYAQRNSTGVDFESLRKTLFEENTVIQGRGIRGPNPRLREDALRTLESDGSQEAINILLEFLTNNRMDRKLKQYALASLGKIGTEAAIEAIKKFEEWSRKRYTEPHPFEMTSLESPIDHMGGIPFLPVAQANDSENKSWSLIPLDRYGQPSLFLISQIKADQWSEPILLDIPGLINLSMTQMQWNINCKLQVEGDIFKVECNNEKYEMKISDLQKDTDKDGLYDVVEIRLETNPAKSDSDGDGVPDGNDSNPLTPKHKETNDITEIRQAAFSGLFATSNSRNALVIVDRDEFAKQEYYGFAGPVLRSSQARDRFVNVTAIEITSQADDSATVRIGDYEGPMAGSTHEVQLKKINGKWVVVGIRLRGIA